LGLLAHRAVFDCSLPLAAMFAGLPRSSSEPTERKSVVPSSPPADRRREHRESAAVVVPRRGKNASAHSLVHCSLRSLRLALVSRGLPHSLADKKRVCSLQDSGAPAWLRATARDSRHSQPAPLSWPRGVRYPQPAACLKRCPQIASCAYHITLPSLASRYGTATEGGSGIGSADQRPTGARVGRAAATPSARAGASLLR
jgi:hypothetical protein